MTNMVRGMNKQGAVMNEPRDILRRMCRLAREERRAWHAAAQAGFVAVAEIHRGRWDALADACHTFAAREGLKIRAGRTTGKF